MITISIENKDICSPSTTETNKCTQAAALTAVCMELQKWSNKLNVSSCCQDLKKLAPDVLQFNKGN